jgi:hypothetical protein
MTVVPHPPYSPDLALCDFLLFPKLKMVLEGSRFNDVTMIQAKSQDALSEFQTTDLGNSLNGGTITGLNAQSPTDTTLKEKT